MPVQTVIGARPPSHAASLEVTPHRIARSRAPLRLGLAGGGTDVSPYCDDFGGLVLNTTIDRYCHTTVSEGTDDAVRFCAADQHLGTDMGPAGRGPAGLGTSALPLHEASYRRVCQEFGLGRPALTLTTASDAPPGSGLGSSSTMVVSIVEALREYFSLPLDRYDVARLAFIIEREDCGFGGGRQDQYAATFGGFNSMEFQAGVPFVSPLRIPSAIVQEFEASIVLYYTGVSRASAEIIAEQAGHVRSGEERQIEATHALKQEAVAMRDALVVGDLSQVAAVINRGWQAKKQLAGAISSPEIETVLAAASGAGALAGKVSGAGGGGYVILIVDPVLRPSLVATLSALSGQAGLAAGRVETVHFVEEGAVAWTVR